MKRGEADQALRAITGHPVTIKFPAGRLTVEPQGARTAVPASSMRTRVMPDDR
jgi:hypothetical protein